MELELKYLAPYFQYNLSLLDENRVYCYLRTMYSDCIGVNYEFNIGEYEKSFNSIEPILRLLSEFGDSDDLRKVHEFIGLGKWCDAYDDYFKAWFDDAENVNKLILQAPYEIFQYFLSNHYDVFELIKNGLAVDINTLSA